MSLITRDLIKLIIIICIDQHSSIDFKHFVIRTGRVAISSDCLSVYTRCTCVQGTHGCLETVAIHFNNGFAIRDNNRDSCVKEIYVKRTMFSTNT